MSTSSHKVTQESALAPLMTWFHTGLNPVRAQTSGKLLQPKTFDSFQGMGLPPLANGSSPKEFAVSLLRAGAEIEHSLAIQYLYAGYSVDETSEGPRNIPALDWKTTLRLVAREEMAHLVTVQNLLRALDKEPHLNRGPIHRNERDLPLPFELEALNRESMGKFVLFESPEPGQIKKSDLDVIEEIRTKAGKKARVLRVGSIYAALYWLFMEDDEPGPEWPFSLAEVPSFIQKYGENYHLQDTDFARVADYQDKAASAKEWGVFESSTHVDGASPRENALASLRWIMSQGEGPNALEDSHFYRFLKIYRDFDATDIKSEHLIMNVPWNPLIEGTSGSNSVGVEVGTVVKNRGSARWGALFNLRYQLMLLNILESLIESRKTMAERRRLLARWAALEMEFVKKIGQALPRMFLLNQKKKRKDVRRKQQNPPLKAGAPFQTVFLPKTSEERKKLRHELLYASGECISDLQGPELDTFKYTDDGPTAAIVPGLLEAIARQDDEMRRDLE